jgi:hypothetical protein
MPSTPVRRTYLVLLGLAVTAAGVWASPLSAAAEEARDPGRDVRSGPLYTDDLPRHPEPARRVGDFTRTTATLGDDLVVTSRFRSLAAVGEQDFSWVLLTSDHEDGSWIAYLTVRPGKDKGRFDLIDPVANQPHCATAVLDRAARTVTLTVPADCLGDPDWVRVGNGLSVITDTRVYTDDARRDADVRHGWKLGPKVKPG